MDVARGRVVPTRIIKTTATLRECVGLSSPDGELICTPDHPVFAPQTGAYEPASRWVEGALRRILVERGGEVSEVEVGQTRDYAGVHQVIDITVESSERNFIAGGVVVHNKSIEGPVLSATVDGPQFELTPTEPERTFTLPTCIGGDDPPPETGVSLDIDSFDLRDDTTNPMWWAMYLDTGEDELEFVDRAAGEPARAWIESYPRLCSDPVTVVFARLDGLGTGEIDFSWQAYAELFLPPGAAEEDVLDIQIDG